MGDIGMTAEARAAAGKQAGDRSSAGPTLVYIAGTAYSGSTLLSFVLNSHPEIFGIGEMHAPVFPLDRQEERMCSCGERMGNCPFFAELARRLSEKGIAFDPIRWSLLYEVEGNRFLSRLMFGSLRSSSLESARDVCCELWPAYRRRRAKLDRENEESVRTALCIRGAEVFVDANKDPMRIRHLRRLRNVELKVIHLIRDPRAYLCSVLSRRPETPVLRSVRGWCRCNRNIERHVAPLGPDKWTRLRYELFCNNPTEELARLGRFIGVGTIEVPSDYRAREHHVMGNRMRLSPERRTIKPLDERWRIDLSEEDLATAVDVAGPLARKYGYEI